MRSQLTFHVFRQLLRNKPLSFYGRSVSLIGRCWRWKTKYGQSHSRHLWGFSQKPPREIKAQSLAPGYGPMMRLSSLLHENARPPPPAEIAKAFKDFFGSFQGRKIVVEEVQSSIAITSFKYLQEKGQGLNGFGLSLEDLQDALSALSFTEKKPENQRRKELAGLIIEELKQRTNNFNVESAITDVLSNALYYYLRILSHCGEILAARELLSQYQGKILADRRQVCWGWILAGFAKEKNEEELRRTLDLMQEHGLIFDPTTHKLVTMPHIKLGDLEGAKRWYEHPIVNSGKVKISTKISMLRLCLLRRDFEWGQPIVEEFTEQHPNKSQWDLIFQWAAATGKGVDAIERMMEVMVRRSEEQGKHERPDIETINGLVDVAIEANDPYTAERYMVLAQKWSIPLNGRTFLLQFDYRLKKGDIDGARSAYTHLQAHERSEEEDIHTLNKLIIALCEVKRPDYTLIMQYTEDLIERNARFEPGTVSALCRIHLARNELHDVLDLLQTHTFHYDMKERTSVRDVFVEFCLDRSNSTSQAWDVYSIAQEIFSEMDTNTRLRLMNEFFARGRSDMAIHVFGHMRQQPVRTGRPNAEAYTQCFEGIAKNEDYDSLKLVHNMLKLDSNVEPDTRVYNSLMLAYINCGEPYQGLEFWDDIQYSREGPTYSSICIALRACERSPHGDRHAQEIWSKLQKFEIEINKDIYVAYIGVLAAHGLLKDAMSLMSKMQGEIGCPPDVSTLGMLYNVSPGDTKKSEVELWAQETYPAAWQGVQALGRIETKEGNMLYKVDRQLSA